MKVFTVSILFAATLLLSCKNKNGISDPSTGEKISITGTWQLLTGTVIEKGDTVITNYNKNKSFIKIINDTHFSFLQHDLNKGIDSAAIFVAGGGKYTLKDSTYTENLEYCSARNWEGNDFNFTVRVSNNTLVQTGIEKVKGTNINRLNIEKYVRSKKL